MKGYAFKKNERFKGIWGVVRKGYLLVLYLAEILTRGFNGVIIGKGYLRIWFSVKACLGDSTWAGTLLLAM